MKNHYLILLCLLFSIKLIAQQVRIGNWYDHLAYSNANSIALHGDELFCGTESGVYSYNLTDNSISRYNTINILSDVASQKLANNPFNNVLCIFYTDGNIDLVKDGKATNIPYIKNTHSIVKKDVNEVSFHKEFAFIVYDFGLIKMNTDKNEISESYSFESISGANSIVKSAVVYQGSLYVATNKGVYQGSLSSNLLDFNNWNIISELGSNEYEKLFVFNNQLYTIKSGANKSLWEKEPNSWTQQNIDLTDLNFIKSEEARLILVYYNKINILDKDLNVIKTINGNFQNATGYLDANETKAFVSERNAGIMEFNDGYFIQSIKPDGPMTKNAYDIEARNNNIWVIKGGLKNYWNNMLYYGELYHYDGVKWNNHSPYEHPLYQKAYDLVDITIDPNNDNKVYLSSAGGGLLELKNGTPIELYTDTNSSIESRPEFTYFGIGGTAFDDNGNLWVSNSYSINGLSVKKTNGSWKNFDLSGYAEFYTTLEDVVISDAGHIWIMLPRYNEIIVYDHNGTIDNSNDDKILKLNSNVTQGNIPGATGITVAIDQNGDAWAGSVNGVFVFYNADNIFENYKNGAQRIIIDAGENNEILLETVVVRDIAIDGANRKWIATDGSGVYLLSEDGKKEIHHFTMENSPLFSDVVGNIAIDHSTGMVYFGTDKGIIAYRSDATSSKENFSEITIFPNPVRPEYKGPISISGLLDNTTIKVTDISGHLVNEIRSNGGMAIWNGNDFNGKRASTGVYLLFSSALDKENQLQTKIGKILFIK